MANSHTDQIEAFADEYRALCERHGLRITYDEGYVSYEVSAIPDDGPDWVDFYWGGP